MVAIGPLEVNKTNRTLFALFFLVFGFNPNWATDPITIEVGTLSAEDGDGWILSQIYAFEQHFPNIKIQHFALGSPSRDDTRIENLSELALNVVGIRSDMGYEVGYLVDRDLIRPIDSFLPDPEFQFTDFFSNTWDAVSYRGQKWGVPFLVSSVVFVVDWDLFKSSGISELPETWEDVFAILPKITRDTDADGELDQWGFRLGMRGSHDTHMFFLWMTMVLQQGGDVMKDGRFDLSHPALRRSYDTLVRLRDSWGSREDNRRFKNTAGDLSSRYGMQVVPSYFLNPLMKQHNYRIVPWPTFGEEVILDERRHYLAIAKSTPEKEQASWEFVKWVTRSSANHPDGAWTFHLSARQDLLDRVDIQHRIEGWADGFDIMHRTKGWNVQPGDQIGGRFEAMNHLEEIITRLFHGEFDFDEGMRRAEKECNSILLESTINPEPYSLYLIGSTQEIDDATVSKICDQYADVVRCFPSHPGSFELLSQIQRTLGSHEEDLLQIVKGFHKHPIGLLAFDKLLGLSEPKNRLKTINWTLRNLPDTPIARSALHKKLMARYENKSELLSALAQNRIPSATLSTIQEIEWIALADALRDHREFGLASLYYLQFWEKFPEWVETMGLDRKIIACLRNAESFLEAETLATSNRKGFTAGRLLRELQSRNPDFPGSKQSDSFRTASDLWVEDLRIVCASASQGIACLNELDRLLLEENDQSQIGTTDSFHLNRMALYSRGVVDLFVRLACHGDGSRSLMRDYVFDIPKKKELALRVTERALDLSCLAALNNSDLTPLVFDSLDSRILVGNQIGASDRIEAAYRKVLEEFKDANESPRYAIELAKFLKNQNLNSALEVCETIEIRYNGTQEATQARRMHALWLFQAARYTEAKSVIESMHTGTDLSEDEIRVLSGLCDFALGDREGVEELAMSFINKFPEHEVSNELKVWLISNRVRDVRFLDADRLVRDFLKESTDRITSDILIEINRKLRGSSVPDQNSLDIDLTESVGLQVKPHQ